MDQPPPKESRAPINLRIKFRSESIDEFIERYSIDVSRGGIFIRTREPLAVGTQLKFDFQLQDSSPLMAGEGTVVWIREYDPNRTGITPGMGVRFDKLTPTSQPILEKILAEKGRRDHAASNSGGIMSKVGAGMAVRRPSSTFTALDPRAVGLPVAAPQPMVPVETPPTDMRDAARRERRTTSGAMQQNPIDKSGAVTTVERTQQGFASASSSATSPIERTNQGGFGSPHAPRHPAPMTLPTITQRPRTPGALPTLETPGSGRANASGDVPSLVSRLTGSRPATYEPPSVADIDKALDTLTPAGVTAPGSRLNPPAKSAGAAAGGGIPEPRDDDQVSEPTKTGDALADFFHQANRPAKSDQSAATTLTSAADALAAAEGVAVPIAEVDSDRTVATTASEIEDILARSAEPLEKTARDLVPASPSGSEVASGAAADESPVPEEAPLSDTKPLVPSLILIRNDAPAVKADQPPMPSPAPAQPAPEPRWNVPSITAGMIAAPAAIAEPAAKATPAAASTPPSGSAAAKSGTPGVAAVAASAIPAAAKSGTARPGSARKSRAPLIGAVLVAAAAVIAVVVSQQSGSEHASESFHQPQATAVPAPAPMPTPTAAPAATEPAAAAAAATAAATAPSPSPTEPAGAPAPEPSKVVEAAKPAAEAIVADAPKALPAAEPARAATKAPNVVRVERNAAGGVTRTAVTARKVAAAASAAKKAVAVVAPGDEAAPLTPALTTADAVEPGADLTTPPSKPAIQHILKITSTPPGAEVLIDGQSVGKTPFQARELDADAPHAVTIRLDGYEAHDHMISASDWLKVKAGLETAKVSVKLRRATGAPAAEGAAATADSPKSEAAARSDSSPKAEGTATEKPEKIEKTEKTEKTEPPAATEPPKAKDDPSAPMAPTK